MEGENQAEKALILIRSRICNPSYIFTPFSDSPESNYSKLKFIISNSVTDFFIACNNSTLLLGPRGCGKIAVCSLFRVNCIRDADQLLEKRVRSHFSHRKLLFLPPSKEELQKLLEHILSLPIDSSFSHDYAIEFNAKLHKIVGDCRFTEIVDTLSGSDSTVNHLLKFLFRAVCCMDLDFGFLTLENSKTAILSIQRQPKLECLQADCSILELYILVCMMRLEDKEQNSYNFNSVMKEYKGIHDSYQTSDYYARNVCLRAFEHLLQCELICFTENRGQSQSVEFRPVKLLISSHELYPGLKSNRSCPVSCL
ncbi:hypothetical protein HHK36_020211 [Tetracentron sinense]|uniref:Origin recognition complex subunit 4 C-terminal domain-containing protein n=1 Tax=Tetracentron sinense TaxID=13715 RepID=A0A835DBF0_TETSI|nr:hypothetical protein HHK36_020211 [Tetracentron sinense]